MAIRFLSGQTIDGTLQVTGNVQAATFNTLPIATGVNNVANQIVRTQANGYVDFGWINSISGNHTGSITRITASNDQYLRYVTPAQFRTGVTDGFYAPASTVSGVTSVATGNGLTGGTITSTGTLTMSGSYTGAFSVTGFTTSTTGFGINYVSGGTVPMVILANATDYGIFYREASPDHIEFKHGGVVRQSFDGNGNVDIEGNLTLNNNIFTASGDLTINNPLDTNSNLIIAGRYDLGATTLSFRSGHGGNNNVWDMATILVEDDANYNGRIMFRTSPVGYGNTPTTKMTIRSSGAIAFGTGISDYGSSGQVLKSNGNASPAWVDASTVIGGPYLPLSGGTVTGLTYFTASESIRLKGIRGQFTNEFMHLYNKVGIGNPAGWGQGETSTPNQGLSTYGAGYFAYGTGAASTFLGDLTVSKGTPIIKALDGTNNHYLFIAADASNSFMRSDNNLLLQVDGGNVTALTFDNVGSATFSGYTYFPNYLFHAGDTNTRIQFGTGTITLRGDSGITLDGNVTNDGSMDINAGTAYPLQVNSTQRYMIQIRNPNNTVNSGYGWWWGTDTNFNMFFHADGSADKMTLTRGGNLGIGTTSPGYPLDVASVEVAARFTGSQTGHTQGAILLSSGTDSTPQARGQGVYRFNEGNDETWYTGTAYANTNRYIWARKTSTTSFDSGAAQLTYALMALTNVGDVGIGTNDPFSRLQVGSHMSGNEITIGGYYISGGGSLNWRSGHPNNSAVWNMARINVTDDGNYNGRMEFKTTTSGGNSGVEPTQKMVLKANGRLGVGTSAPEGILDVTGDIWLNSDNNNSAYYLRINRAQSQDGGILLYGNKTLDWQLVNLTSRDLNWYSYTAASSVMRLTGAGNLGINTTNPLNKLHVDGNIQIGGWTTAGSRYVGTARVDNGSFGNGAAGMEVESVTESGLGNYDQKVHLISHRYNGGTSRVLTASWTTGNNRVGIGDTTPSYTLDAAGTIRATGDVIAYSDARVKDNVKTIDNALEKVTKLRGVSYTRNDIEDKSTKVGVIAQEVLKVLPEVVDQDENDKYSVSYGNITGVLIEAIKEQQQQIEYLKIQIKNMSKDN